MARLALLCPPYYSHIRLYEVLGAELVRRGHQLTFILNAGGAGLVRAKAIGVREVARRAGDPLVDAVLDNATRSDGLFGILRTVADCAAMTDQLCAGGPALIRELGIEGIVGDQMEPAAGLLAAGLGLPWVSVASALPINSAPGVPLPYLDWTYDPSPKGVTDRQRAAMVADVLSARHNRVIARWAERLGAGRRRTVEDCLSPTAQIAQLLPGFDFPRPDPMPFESVGPIRDPLAAEEALGFALDPARPLVFASLGTVQGGRVDLFRSLGKACRAAGAQLVVAHCGKLTRAQAASIDADYVTDFLPQRAVLKAASLCVSHGGLNTVLDSIEAGTPMLVRPFAFDQKGNCARVIYRGLGERIASTRRPRALAEQIARLLADEAARRGVEKLAREVRHAGGTARAADIVEQAITPATSRLDARAFVERPSRQGLG